MGCRVHSSMRLSGCRQGRLPGAVHLLQQNQVGCARGNDLLYLRPPHIPVAAKLLRQYVEAEQRQLIRAVGGQAAMLAHDDGMGPPIPPTADPADRRATIADAPARHPSHGRQHRQGNTSAASGHHQRHMHMYCVSLKHTRDAFSCSCGLRRAEQ